MSNRGRVVYRVGCWANIVRVWQGDQRNYSDYDKWPQAYRGMPIHESDIIVTGVDSMVRLEPVDSRVRPHRVAANKVLDVADNIPCNSNSENGQCSHFALTAYGGRARNNILRMFESKNDSFDFEFPETRVTPPSVKISIYCAGVMGEFKDESLFRSEAVREKGWGLVDKVESGKTRDLFHKKLTDEINNGNKIEYLSIYSHSSQSALYLDNGEYSHATLLLENFVREYGEFFLPNALVVFAGCNAGHTYIRLPIAEYFTLKTGKASIGANYKTYIPNRNTGLVRVVDYFDGGFCEVCGSFWPYLQGFNTASWNRIYCYDCKNNSYPIKKIKISGNYNLFLRDPDDHKYVHKLSIGKKLDKEAIVDAKRMVNYLCDESNKIETKKFFERVASFPSRGVRDVNINKNQGETMKDAIERTIKDLCEEGIIYVDREDKNYFREYDKDRVSFITG